MKYFLLLLLCLPCPLALAQNHSLTVRAEQGDGIYSLLRKHNINPTKHYNRFVELNDSLLVDNEFLRVGQVYQLPDTTLGQEPAIPAIPEKPRYAIFGKQYEQIDSLSNRLQGTVYYLISGHGGPDPGALATYKGSQISEDEYAYDITLRLARELMSHGAEVHLIIKDNNDGIRDDRILELDYDEVAHPDLKIPLNQKARLKQRCDVVNELYKKNLGKYQRLIATHVDSRSVGTTIDVFFYHHQKSSNGKRLAESIHKTFQRKYARFQPNRGYKGTFQERSNLYVVKHTLPAIAYIEIGNIRNKKDQKRILEPDNRQALAKWISEGVLLDYESLENN